MQATEQTLGLKFTLRTLVKLSILLIIDYLLLSIGLAFLFAALKAWVRVWKKAPDCGTSKRRSWKKLFADPGVVYALLLTTFVVAIWLDIITAESRAHPIIKAVETYHADNGVYPQELDQLIPEYLSKIPTERFTRFGLGFRYFPGPPRMKNKVADSKDYPPMLMWTVVPPFGRRFYHFDDKSWNTVD